ncbi:type I-C CRISPR-associated protein Cas7/Csd2 [Ligilactobacillus sp. Marseille-Q7487]|uniref:type I-C CRISPR-associated protein Cas7/Csd2 n=1 Tax=Ligilactobacillus sp. Marseille-Q7487 TaxID=3022128 RepID=UPI0024A7C7DF|nr:type I-C CRISPR-associated protein Cas7/Csd2 [Ligilactobacillus sp. Marseille-Q7487]
MINNKIDFIMTIDVKYANPNGDPLAGNMPRIDSNGYGLISDVAIKRKIRNRMQDMGYDIFVKSRDRIDDDFMSLQKRFEASFTAKDSDEKIEKESNEKWLDVRTFGQVITFLKKSIGIRGPVSISIARSLRPIATTTMQITRSTNGMETKKESGRSSDTMGSKHFVEQEVYVVYGSVNAYLSEKTGFDDKDLAVLKEALLTLFENDASSARPEGSMAIKDLFWFEHSNKLGNVSSANIRELLTWTDTKDMANVEYNDYQIKLDEEKLAKYQAQGLTFEHLTGK